MYKFIMTCEGCVGVVVYIVTYFTRTIFSGIGESLAQKSLLYGEQYEDAEVFDGVWSVMIYSDVGFYRCCFYNII